MLSNTESRKIPESRERNSSEYSVPLGLFTKYKLITRRWSLRQPYHIWTDIRRVMQNPTRCRVIDLRALPTSCIDVPIEFECNQQLSFDYIDFIKLPHVEQQISIALLSMTIFILEAYSEISKDVYQTRVIPSSRKRP